MHICTNNQPRDLLNYWELSDTEQKEFDYLPEGEGSFFRYKGRVHDLGEFVLTNIAGWDGARADGFFCGLLVRIVDNGDRVVVGLYTC